MAKVVYSMFVSLDGFIETPDRSLDWIPVDEELHRFFNEQAPDAEVFLYGRRLYEVMSAWQTRDADPSAPDHEVEFARIWQATPKIVFSKTLTKVGPNATLVSEVVPADITELKQQSSNDIEVGGPALAAHFMRLGLIDEYRLSVVRSSWEAARRSSHRSIRPSEPCWQSAASFAPACCTCATR